MKLVRKCAISLAALGMAVSTLQSQEPRTFSGTAQVTAVDLMIEVRGPNGEVPTDLSPDDFEVVEDGEVRTVVAVEAFDGSLAAVGPRTGTGGRGPERRSESAAEPAWTWRIVVYIDQVMSSSRSIRRTCEALASQAGRLVELGTVEVVIANPGPEVVLPPTRSGQLVEQTLTRLARETPGRDALRQIRRQFLSTMQLKGEFDGTGVPVTGSDPFAGGGTGGASGVRGNGRGQGNVIRDGSFLSRRTLIRAAVPEELGLLRGQHDAMMAWLSGYAAAGARALVMVNDGYDLDPRDFYLAGTAPGSSFFSEVNADLQNVSIAPDTEELGQQLSASGWVTLGVVLGGLEGASTMGADISGRGRLGDLIAGRQDTLTDLPTSLVVSPLAPIDRLARQTGGELLTGINKLPGSLDRLRERVRLTYQVSRLPDGELHAVEVRSKRPDWKVRAPRWSGSPAPEALAAARVRGLLKGEGERGELPLTAAVALEEERDEAGRRAGRLQARVALDPLKEALATSYGTPLRVTFGVSFPDEPPFVHHEQVPVQQLAGLDVWTYGMRVRVPGTAEKVAVVVEELGTGGWGGALAAMVVDDGSAPSEESENLIPDDLLPGRKAVFLLPPPGDVVTGKVRFEAAVGDGRVARVDFLVDSSLVGRREAPPWEVRADLGKLPALQQLEAVAFDDRGREVGRDSRQVNAGVGSFGVRIIEPRPGRRLGSVNVEAEVRLPTDGELDRLELFWNGERTATLFDPPFRQRLEIPADSPVGYLTAVAFDRAGERVEDVVFLNGEGTSERLEVQLVELFTVVTSPEGRPVRDVESDELRVFENGQRQQLEDFRPGTEMPLKLGLLLDTSASMTPALRAVQTAAIDFLLVALQEEDQAFLVDFKETPRLAQSLTGDRRALVQAIAKLRAGGTSALCDALIYSLVQMQDIAGRRALVVLSDGVGRNERVSFNTCLRFVQRNGLPVYAILLAGDDPTAEDGGISKQRLERLVGTVGGRVFAVADPTDLGGVYRSLVEELRSQVLLTYTPPFIDSEDWRIVNVEVDRPGHRARTRSGYYP
ncbi:MAG: VWA domain-containing protein [Acidobacteriota bacterium]